MKRTKHRPSTVKERVRKYRKRKHDQGYKQGWVLFKGLEKIGTQRVKRKGRMLPRKTKSTWLKKPPKYGKPPARKNTF